MKQCQTKTDGHRCTRPKGHVGDCDGAITLTAMLAVRGYRHRPSEGLGGLLGAHDIIDRTGAVVATLKAHEAWAWLSESRERTGE